MRGVRGGSPFAAVKSLPGFVKGGAVLRGSLDGVLADVDMA